MVEVVITDSILKLLKMLVYGKNTKLLTTHKFVRLQEVY